MGVGFVFFVSGVSGGGGGRSMFVSYVLILVWLLFGASCYCCSKEVFRSVVMLLKM